MHLYLACAISIVAFIGSFPIHQYYGKWTYHSTCPYFHISLKEVEFKMAVTVGFAGQNLYVYIYMFILCIIKGLR